MLQQTTVTTVIPYFHRFIADFPTVQALAQASLDDVLAAWSGLGYYARARNLHAAAQWIAGPGRGEFPRTASTWATLPGVGPSTAAAIVAFAFDVRAPILDANVRRVLSRYHGLTGRDAATLRRLWAYAEHHTPGTDVATYTQAIMDLGALVCRRTPDCHSCPLAGDCAHDGQTITQPKPARPERHAVFAIIEDAEGAALLVRRPPHGVWGGLWSLPECASLDELPATLRVLGVDGGAVAGLPPVRHLFTHFALSITPVRLRAVTIRTTVGETRDMMWYKRGVQHRPGMPAPVRRLLDQLTKTEAS